MFTRLDYSSALEYSIIILYIIIIIVYYYYPTPTSPSYQNSYDCRFKVLQLNPNGIGNKLRELGVVMETNKVKVAVIQESKLTPKFKNPCIQNYTTVRKDRPHGHGAELLFFIHRYVNISKQPSSAE